MNPLFKGATPMTKVHTTYNAFESEDCCLSYWTDCVSHVVHPHDASQQSEQTVQQYKDTERKIDVWQRQYVVCTFTIWQEIRDILTSSADPRLCIDLLKVFRAATRC